jgi:tetratricopeptide (TPR) repeat protein
VKKPLKLLLLILLAGPIPGLGQQSALTFDSLITKAQQAQSAHDYAAAAIAYKQAVKIQTNMAELWANLGLMEHETGDFPEAIQSFEHANRLNPSLYVPNLFLGTDYVRVGKVKEALPFLSKAEKSNSTDPQAPLALGRAYIALGKSALAANELRRSVSLDPRQGTAWFALGIAYLNQVEADSRRMSEENHDSMYAKVLFAESLDKQSRYSEAVRAYRSVIDTKSQPPCLHSELGMALLRAHDVDGAAQEFKAEQEANPECSAAMLGEARIALDKGANEEVLKILETLGDRDEGFMRSNMPLLAEGISNDRLSGFVTFLAQQHNASQSVLFNTLSAAFTAAAGSGQQFEDTSEPQDSRTAKTQASYSGMNRNAAEKYYASGQFQKCAVQLRPALATMRAEDLLLLAACSFFTGDFETASRATAALPTVSAHQPDALYWSIKANEQLAFRSLARFEQLEPNSARSHILLGDIYRQRRVYDDALNEYRKALEVVPDDPAAMLGMASAYLGNDNVDKTLETLRAALPHSPDDPELNLLMAEALIAHHDVAEAEPYLYKSMSAKAQMLPHVHALLGEVYAEAGRTQDAINQLKRGTQSDEDGSVHYQLARLYRQAGDNKSAADALEEMKAIKKQQRERAAIKAQDALPPSAEDLPQ